MKKIHYSWVICITCTLITFVTGGMMQGAFNVYLPYITFMNDFTEVQISSIVSMRYFSKFISLLMVEWFYKKTNVRLGVTIAMFFAAGSYIICGFAKSFTVYCISSLFAGAAYGLAATMSPAILMNRWFDDKRGCALGIAAAGTGIATIVLPPIVTFLIEEYSIQTACIIEAIFIIFAMILVFFLLRNEPALFGILPYRKKHGVMGRKKNIRYNDYNLSKKDCNLMIIAMVLLASAANTPNNFLPKLYLQAGKSSIVVAWLLSFSGVAVITGKILIGMTADRIGTKKATMIFGILLTNGLVLSVFATLPVIFVAALSIFCLGLGFSLSTVALPLWAADLSKRDQYTKAVKRLELGYAAGSVLFTYLTGWIAEIAGNYYIAFMMYSLNSLLAIAIILYIYTGRDKAINRLLVKELIIK